MITISDVKRTTYNFDPAKLKKRRESIGKTQAEIAAASGEHLANYARMEGGANCNPTLDKAVRVAKALGCLVEDLIGQEYR